MEIQIWVEIIVGATTSIIEILKLLEKKEIGVPVGFQWKEGYLGFQRVFNGGRKLGF